MERQDPLSSWREKFEGAEEIPGYYTPDKADLWRRMQEKMAARKAMEQPKEKKKKKVTYWYSAAASLIMMMLLFITISGPDDEPVIANKPVVVPSKKIEQQAKQDSAATQKPVIVLDNAPVNLSAQSPTKRVNHKNNSNIKTTPPEVPQQLVVKPEEPAPLAMAQNNTRLMIIHNNDHNNPRISGKTNVQLVLERSPGLPPFAARYNEDYEGRIFKKPF